MLFELNSDSICFLSNYLVLILLCKYVRVKVQNIMLIVRREKGLFFRCLKYFCEKKHKNTILVLIVVLKT
jgi:hypothetical protein